MERMANNNIHPGEKFKDKFDGHIHICQSVTDDTADIKQQGESVIHTVSHKMLERNYTHVE